MKFKFIFINKAGLKMAIEKGNIEVVQLLMPFFEIDPNLKIIINHFF